MSPAVFKVTTISFLRTIRPSTRYSPEAAPRSPPQPRSSQVACAVYCEVILKNGLKFVVELRASIFHPYVIIRHKIIHIQNHIVNGWSKSVFDCTEIRSEIHTKIIRSSTSCFCIFDISCI